MRDFEMDSHDEIIESLSGVRPDFNYMPPDDIDALYEDLWSLHGWGCWPTREATDKFDLVAKILHDRIRATSQQPSWGDHPEVAREYKWLVSKNFQRG